MEQKLPIVLDCFAEWCAPCKKLEPVLKDIVLSFDGKLKMVKLNIDNLPQLSTGLNIRSLPTVFLIYKGNIIDTFSGIPSEERL